MANKINVVLEKSIDFALMLIEFCELLENSRKFVVANQLLKSGTSIGANLHEAQNAESKTDFVHNTLFNLNLLNKNAPFSFIL